MSYIFVYPHDQRTLELLKDGTALADLGQALFGTIGDAAVSDSLQNEVNMPAIGYFVLLLLLIKNRNQGWRTNRGNSLLSFKCCSDATDLFTSSES